MKFDWPSCALGLILGMGSIVCIIFAAEIKIFVDTPLCAEGENGLTCARNWANALAILGAAGTIYFLATQQSFARELAILQTLDVRARVATATRVARSLRNHAGWLRTSGFRWEGMAEKNARLPRPRAIIRTILNIERSLREELWLQVADFEVQLSDERIKILLIIEDLLRAFLGDNLTAVREGYPHMADHMINEQWNEDIQPGEIIDLSYKVDALGSEIETLCSHLSSFRASEYFRREKSQTGINSRKAE